ncbi:MupA/Atu3671 family FMN-dependent luciferase-like monooxygenase [Saccharothrix deserti]|uniref:MupA/Atu3671 family FMN-dependent luciferase-like monooxygenase n=1 Tax=Saccharothrix deserti TaxID=2593674 RepID=UPI00131CE395|nr:MupA/Atu3671 family FMN-dependent luciferase-like monooxygenase [Saccharothrix deserti]
MDLSLFYFADEGSAERDRYRLLLSGARFADEHGFAAVWTPERHFHPFGGIFPNPALTAAAVAAVTSRVAVRAGSVVAPLHHPLRLAEEWAVVDNLSNGRAGLSLAAGWHQRDFVFNPSAYEDRYQVTADTVATLRSLWAGGGYGGHHATDAEYRIYPPPVQTEIPLWLTASRSPETFKAAGKVGTGVLTHLLNQTQEELAEKIASYRGAYAASGRAGRGHVVVMLHTYLDTDLEAAQQHARAPLERYLISSLDLNLSSGGDRRGQALSDSRARMVIGRAYQRYLHQDGLFGSVEDALRAVERIRALDVDEIACLIDFGIPTDVALSGLTRLAALREAL